MEAHVGAENVAATIATTVDAGHLNTAGGLESSGNGDDWADAIAAMEKAKMVNPGAKPTDYFTNDYLDINLIKKIGGS